MKRLLKELLVCFLAISIITPQRLKAETFDVTFNANGGLYDQEESVSVAVKEDGTIGEENWPANPTRTGYVFDGYDSEADYNTEFLEETTLTANWLAKTTNITFNKDEGVDGDNNVVATYGNQLPSIVVPNKEGYNFLGYFDEDNVQYYDSEGNSLIDWNKEDEACELLAHYEENQPLLSNPITKYTATIDLNGGTLIGNVPEGWSASDAYYVKEFDADTDCESILNEWVDVNIDKEGYITLNPTWYWDRTPYRYNLTEDVVFTVRYDAAAKITSESVEHGTVDVKINKVSINSFIYFKDNCIVDYWDQSKVIIEVNTDDSYAVDYWIINGVKQTGSDYFVDSDITIIPHIAISYGIKVFGQLVTAENNTDILGDGTCSYDPSTKVLTICNPQKVSDSDKNYYYGGIIADDDLTINCVDNIFIYQYNTTTYKDYYGYFGIICDGTLTFSGNASLEISTGYISEGSSIGIYAKDIVINSGSVSVSSYTYGIYAENSFTVNSTNKPYVSASSHNLTSIMASSMALNGAVIYGATEEYIEGTTHNLFQQASTPVIITYEELVTQYDIWVGDVRVTDENKDTSYNFSYDPETNTLNVTSYISGSYGYGIYSVGDLNIKVGNESSNYVYIGSSGQSTTGESYGIYCTGDLTIYSDYDNTLSVSSYRAAIKSVGIFCDGKLTLKSRVDAVSQSVYNNNDNFTISAGAWARKGIDVIGTDKNTCYLSASGAQIKENGYTNYGILSGDGNPGFDEEAEINITNGKIFGITNDSTSGSSYGVYSYGSINLNNAAITAGIDEGISEDSSIIYCGNNMNMINNSEVMCADVKFFDSSLAIKGLEVAKTLTVDNSKIEITKTVNDYYLPMISVKKYQGIYVKNLVVKGSESYIFSEGLKTASGECSAIYVKQQLDVENGKIRAVADEAGENSYGIYAGRDSFNGSHIIKNGNVIAYGKAVNEGESVGLRTKKGNLNIVGGLVELGGETNGLNASGVITIDVTSDAIRPYIAAKSTNKKAIYSKEPLVINNNACIDNSSTYYFEDETSELIQSDSNPIVIRYKTPANVSGVQMAYPEGKTSFTYGDIVSYTGTPVVTNSVTHEVVPDTVITSEDFGYYYSKKVDDEYIDINGTPFEAGEYKLLVTYDNDIYEGKQEIEFSIDKREVTLDFDCLQFDYDNNSHYPKLVIGNLLDGDVATFVVAPTPYKNNSEEQIITNAIEPGKYKVNYYIFTTNTYKVLNEYGDDVTNNYKGLAPQTKYTYFYILNNSYETFNVSTGSINNSAAQNSELEPISVENAKVILNDNTDLISAIDGGKEVLIYTQIGDVEDADAFISKNINSDNAFLFNTSLFATITGAESSYLIEDTNGYKLKISIYLSEDQVTNIVGTNKEYFVYRKHNDSISELPCRLDKVNDTYMFTFESDLFSDFAIFSKTKKNNNPSDHLVPKTGD